MIQAILSDLSHVILLPTDETYTGGLNPLHRELVETENYDFWKHFKINEELLEIYQKLRKDVKIYIFTKGYIQEYPLLAERIEGKFDDLFSASRLELDKTNPEAYKEIAKKIKLELGEILFIDDKEKNIAAAKKAGLKTLLHQSNQQTIAEIWK